MKISRELINYVREHAGDDVNALRLKYAAKNESDLGFDPEFAFMQIEARKKTQRKLPDFLKHEDFIFPSVIASEQASNQAVAAFHASILTPGSSLLDLTAGLGIDDMTFCLRGINVTACEIDEYKCNALRHNASVVGVDDRLNVVNVDSIDFLNSNSTHYDVVFADPARRDSSGGRVHAFADCQPDILEALPRVMTVANRLIVKCSPLLDLTLIRKTVSCLSRIYVVCFRGECKEVLVDVVKDSEFSGISVVDLDFDSILSEFHTDIADDSDRDVRYADRRSPADYKYLYEPNSGVMKTGAWRALQGVFEDLYKADVNSHVFLSDTEYPDFPGRGMAIAELLEKKTIKRLKGEKLNVVSRNHPLSAPKIYSKYGITPGSHSFLYAFRYRGNPVMVKTAVTADSCS